MNKLTESQIEILTNYYTKRFDAWETWGDLYDALERHGEQNEYYIHKNYVNTKKQL